MRLSHSILVKKRNNIISALQSETETQSECGTFKSIKYSDPISAECLITVKNLNICVIQTKPLRNTICDKSDLNQEH